MSKKTVFDAAAVCPYYYTSNNVCIRCEGMIEKSVCQHNFPSIADKAVIYTAYCCSVKHWVKCPWAEALNKINN